MLHGRCNSSAMNYLLTRPCRQLHSRSAFTSRRSTASTARGMRWPKAMRLQDLHDIGLHAGRRREHGVFLHEELRVRFAHCLQELRSLPHGLSERHEIPNVVRSYEDMLATLEASPVPRSRASEAKFIDVLNKVMTEEQLSLPLLTNSLTGMRDDLGRGYNTVQPELDAAVERFLQLRAGHRFLAKHYAELDWSSREEMSAYQLECDLAHVAQGAAARSTALCMSWFGEAPEIIVHDEGPNRSCMASPAHVNYILTEIFKNSLRAVVEHRSHGCQVRAPLPSIRCTVNHSEGEARLKISDLGGGIGRARMQDIWKYSFSTSNSSRQLACAHLPAMSGHGMGLPLSRLYARHFGGDLEISSKEGVGSAVYLRLSSKGTERENLPRQDECRAISTIPLCLPCLPQKNVWRSGVLPGLMA